MELFKKSLGKHMGSNKIQRISIGASEVLVMLAVIQSIIILSTILLWKGYCTWEEVMITTQPCNNNVILRTLLIFEYQSIIFKCHILSIIKIPF